MGSVSAMAGLVLTLMRAVNKSDGEEKSNEKSVILFLCGRTERREKGREGERDRGEGEGWGLGVNKGVEIAPTIMVGEKVHQRKQPGRRKMLRLALLSDPQRSISY